MDRYSIIAKKTVPTEEQTSVKQPVKARLKFKQVKRLHEEWVIEDNLYRVALEISPRTATCANYRCKIGTRKMKIKKYSPRYKVIYKGGYYNETRLYHRSCLPDEIREFIKEYSKRDIPEEEMKGTYNQIINILELNKELIGPKYYKQLFNKLRRYLNDNS